MAERSKLKEWISSGSLPVLDEDRDDGAERYLGYAAAVARLKLILLRAKGAVLYKAPAMVVKSKKIATVAKAQKKLAKSADASVAQASDESSDGLLSKPLKPLMQPWMAKAFYGIAGVYFSYDVGSEVSRKHKEGHDAEVLAATVAHGMTFHAAVSFALPAVVIKNAVVGADALFSRPIFASFPRVARFAPPAVGLLCIPFMPMIDGPASKVLDKCFDVVMPRWREGESEHGHHHH
mmetsp:Transcript_1343/g.2835  ORF Transcript_1343/g.2835 Transcript_1343/m.2835 type:complete len:236 (-) Transcript_1343:314-1021(-)|eukprot:CAMPEP_0181205344 /NCGR_PEP_ID=MMETSP1096-20121128/20425_1 /TAXON_ID=156174 ORGANISM="Chrysochromulina ericina, Strain CCMP281" /NCGR_SAMPLE_ID=MMETSP1096 /ASSEMBLY_ACC=CAM_ASM_000453 /LENGTH=235 /DNA_ID=CAMNT_0023296117 /DNA_START=60 /DNA_END=767 /DNA_ORIENTATION=+